MTQVIGVLVSAAALASEAGEAGASLRVFCFNIHHAEGDDGRVDLDRIAEIVRASDPDVVCLQEVDRNLPRTGHVDMPARLAELLRMHAIFEANYRFDGGEYGNCTLTRLPILEHENLALPNPGRAEPRGALRVRVAWNGLAVDVWNTHFGLKPDERKAQGEALAARLGPGPTLACGDFNEDGRGAGLQALLARLHDTFPANAAHTFPAQAPRRRIDYILASEGFQAATAQLIGGALAEIASDHLPLCVELRYSPPPNR
jgi:endonuclease/exonuclease/phosphatase family metal-dependent hydrolase